MKDERSSLVGRVVRTGGAVVGSGLLLLVSVGGDSIRNPPVRW